MVDMALDAKELAEIISPPAPKYPYGLCISLCQDELDKLNLDPDDAQIGAMLHLHCLAKVTSVSSNENEVSGPNCRVELQIIAIAAESEDDENEEADSMPASKKMSKLYKL